MEINFYQVDDVIYKSIAPLLIKVLDENKTALILCQNEAQVAEIDGGLWSFSKTKFVPHGTKADKIDHLKQPVFITSSAENLNQAQYLLMLHEAEEEFLKQFDKIFYFFSSGDIADARKLWAKYKKQSFTLNFYKKNDGAWIKIDL
ncbi:MAG: DNA polymerase III subunit chi [Pseudomonadota bacterium]